MEYSSFALRPLHQWRPPQQLHRPSASRETRLHTGNRFTSDTFFCLVSVCSGRRLLPLKSRLPVRTFLNLSAVGENYNFRCQPVGAPAARVSFSGFSAYFSPRSVALLATTVRSAELKRAAAVGTSLTRNGKPTFLFYQSTRPHAAIPFHSPKVTFASNTFQAA